MPVIPVKTGIQSLQVKILDPRLRLRRNDKLKDSSVLSSLKRLNRYHDFIARENLWCFSGYENSRRSAKLETIRDKGETDAGRGRLQFRRYG